MIVSISDLYILPYLHIVGKPKIHANHVCLMTKMADIPIYGKNY